ncbi:hypothetical protein GQR58_020195 [Nymphon striatum]|nr:hypothetical protein GQR58_020195 [Nymphon striatum]
MAILVTRTCNSLGARALQKSLGDKPKSSTRTTKKVIREMNMAEKSIEIARDRGLATEDLLKYDVLPSPMLFDDHGLMTKPEKSQLIRELEDKLVSDDYSYHHKPESAFIIDVMATVRRVPLIGRTHFSDLLLQLTHITDVYHRYGRCDYIFDIYNDNPLVKDSERLRRCSVNPVLLSLVEQTTPLPKDMSTFWPSNKNKLLLDKLIYSYICEQSSQGHEHPTIVSQLCINSNDWQCKKIHLSTEHYMQRLGSTVEEADLRIPMHVLDCCRAGYKTCVVISNDTDVISASHQNLPPTSQGLKPHIYRAFYNAYITMHVLDRQLNVRTEDLNPVDYGFRLEDGQLLPSTSWKTLEARWFVETVKIHTIHMVHLDSVHCGNTDILVVMVIVHTYGQKRCFCNYDMLTSGYYNFLINNGMSQQFLHNIFNICRQFSAMVCWNPAQESMKNYRYSKCHFCEKKNISYECYPQKHKSTQNGGHFGHHVGFWEMYTLLGLSPKLF